MKILFYSMLILQRFSPKQPLAATPQGQEQQHLLLKYRRYFKYKPISLTQFLLF